MQQSLSKDAKRAHVERLMGEYVCKTPKLCLISRKITVIKIAVKSLYGVFTDRISSNLSGEAGAVVMSSAKGEV